MAIEDGCVLAASIERHADDLDQALLLYERLRAPRTRAAVLGSRDRARRKPSCRGPGRGSNAT